VAPAAGVRPFYCGRKNIDDSEESEKLGES